VDQQRTYFAPAGDLPPQTAMITSRAVVRSAYALIPSSSITDNVRSNLPGWTSTRCWVLAAPAIGFGTAFAQYLIYLDPGGGSQQPEFEKGVESFLFLLDGKVDLRIDGQKTLLTRGGFAFVPPDIPWSIQNRTLRRPEAEADRRSGTGRADRLQQDERSEVDHQSDPGKRHVL
jgi:(S)-ureidoglycine aminohydrolase